MSAAIEDGIELHRAHLGVFNRGILEGNERFVQGLFKWAGIGYCSEVIIPIHSSHGMYIMLWRYAQFWNRQLKMFQQSHIL